MLFHKKCIMVIITIMLYINNNDNIFFVGLKLKLLRKIFEILSNTVIIINEAYGFMLILTFITHFIGISAHLYIVYMTFGEQNYTVDLIVEFLWACFYFGKLIYIISACHSFEREVNLTIIIIIIIFNN